MENREADTRERSLAAGRREFLEKGFRDASLRSIVREAGVTTGAFYGYYHSKAELFDALVEHPYRELMDRFIGVQEDFTTLSPEQQLAGVGEVSGQAMDEMLQYVYDHFEAFKLLTCCAEGTRYEQMIHQMVEIEVQSTHRFVELLRANSLPVREVDPELEHLLCSGLFTAFFGTVVHDMPRRKAAGYVRELRDFYTAGWKKIMGL